jgi:hypothetical protein
MEGLGQLRNPLTPIPVPKIILKEVRMDRHCNMKLNILENYCF